MIQNFNDLVNGSSSMSPAYGCGGARATKNMIARPLKKIWAKPKQAGKKKKGCRGNEFLPACVSVSAFLR